MPESPTVDSADTPVLSSAATISAEAPPSVLAAPHTVIEYREATQPRVQVEIETLSKGAPKITVRVNGDDGHSVPTEAMAIWISMTENLASYSRS